MLGRAQRLRAAKFGVSGRAKRSKIEGSNEGG
jgi:hypothetical protein